MKRLIISSTVHRQTLREYLEDNADMLAGNNIIVADLTHYPCGKDDYDCPGVLCDCSYEELLNAPVELTLDFSVDTYLTQDDLDRCIVKDVHSDSQGYEIIVEGF